MRSVVLLGLTAAVCAQDPSRSPTAAPTAAPSTAPTGQPTATPNAGAAVPTAAPAAAPTAAPAAAPTAAPNAGQGVPTAAPTAAPSAAPSGAPTAPVPTAGPAPAPTRAPYNGTQPTHSPLVPTAAPTVAAAPAPTAAAPAPVDETLIESVRRGISKCLTNAAPATGTAAPASPNASTGTELCAVLPPLNYLVNENYDLVVAFVVAVIAGILWLIGWVAIGKFTVDDGYVDIPRSIESLAPVQSVLVTVSLFVLELPQLIAVSFSSALLDIEYTDVMKQLRDIFTPFALHVETEGSMTAIFGVVVMVVWVLSILVYLPVILHVLAPSCGAQLVDAAQKWPEAAIATLEWVRDLYLFYMALPFFIVLLSPLSCTYYEGPPDGNGEAPTMDWDRSVVCWEGTHWIMVAVSVITMLLYYTGTVAAGMIPFLVKKSTDLSMNGRFTAITIQLRFFLAVTHVCFDSRHAPVQLALTAVGVSALFFFSVVMRPCPVERVNFHRSVSMPFAGWAVLCNCFAAGMEDNTAVTPQNMLLYGWVLFTGTGIVRYIVIPHRKVMPPRELEGGSYEGDVSLGTLLRHGVGTQTWADGAEYVGQWRFGVITNQGVFRLANGMYYEGAWKGGARNGFGKTTIMPRGETEYEGGFVDDEFDGFGVKQFADTESYEGEWRKGLEHGHGTWKFRVGGSIDAVWDGGRVELPDGRHLVDPRTYQGSWRYGVPHGQGTRRYRAGSYKGEFCAGQRHGKAGEMRYANLSRYYGDWFDDCRHGHGSLYGPPIRLRFVYAKTGQCVRLLTKGRKRPYIGHILSKDEDEGSLVVEWNDPDDGGPPPGSIALPSMNVFGVRGSAVSFGTDDEDQQDMDPTEAAQAARADPTEVAQSWFDESAGCTVMQRYGGGWENDEPEGFGRLSLLSGETYKGHWVKGRKRGYGQCNWPDGTEYLGSWEDDDLSGLGQLTYPNGDVYNGPLKQGLRHDGRGIYAYSSGDRYEGEFQRDREHGAGLFAIDGLGHFEGSFLRGVREGRGKFEWSDGSAYEGQWAEDKMDGKGTLTFRTDLTYADLKGACKALYSMPAPKRIRQETCAALAIAAVAAVMGADPASGSDSEGTCPQEDDDERLQGSAGLPEGEDGAMCEAAPLPPGDGDDGEDAPNAPPLPDEEAYALDQEAVPLCQAAPLPPAAEPAGAAAADVVGEYRTHEGVIPDEEEMVTLGAAAAAGPPDDPPPRWVGPSGTPPPFPVAGMLHPVGTAASLVTSGSSGVASRIAGGTAASLITSEGSGPVKTAAPLPPAYPYEIPTAPLIEGAPRAVPPMLVPRLRLEEVAPDGSGQPTAQRDISPRQGADDSVPVLKGIGGGRYDGDWASGKMEGEGVMVFGNGSEYAGDWVNNRPHGKGKWYHADQDATYEGCVEDGRRHGIGMMHYGDGREFLGRWFRDQRHGRGHLKHPKARRPDGTVGYMEWKGWWCHDRYCGTEESGFAKALAGGKLLPSQFYYALSTARSGGQTARSHPRSARSQVSAAVASLSAGGGLREEPNLGELLPVADALGDNASSALSSGVGTPRGPVGKSALSGASPEVFRRPSETSALSGGPPPDGWRRGSAADSALSGGGPQAVPELGSALGDDEDEAARDAEYIRQQLEGATAAAEPTPVKEPAPLPPEPPPASAPAAEAFLEPAAEATPEESPLAPPPAAEATPEEAPPPAAEATPEPAADGGTETAADEVSESGVGSEADPSAADRGRPGRKRRKELSDELNAWKAAFKQQHGRDPTKKDIKKDPGVSKVFAEYTALKEATKKSGKKKGRGKRSRSASPSPAAQDSASSAGGD